MDDMSVLGEAAQEVTDALDQSVELWLNQHLCHQTLTGKLYQPFSYKHATQLWI